MYNNLTKNEKAQSYPRLLQTDGNFLNYKINDLLYGIMYYHATFDTGIKRLYLSKVKFQAEKQEICEIAGINNSRTLKRHLDKLIDAKLIEIDDNKYYFPKEHEVKYQIITRKALKRVLDTKDNNSLRIYGLLLKWYKWKIKENSFYIFTNKEILEKIGYSQDNKKASVMVTQILNDLEESGIISYQDVYINTITADGREVPVPKKKLLYVID